MMTWVHTEGGAGSCQNGRQQPPFNLQWYDRIVGGAEGVRVGVHVVREWEGGKITRWLLAAILTRIGGWRGSVVERELQRDGRRVRGKREEGVMIAGG